MALDLTWLACDLVTGAKIEELPDLKPEGSLASVLSTINSVRFSLPIPQSDSDRDWRAATIPRRTMIVPVLGGQPLEAYAVLVRDSGSGPTISLSCASLECYLDRRYVGDHAWTGVDEATIMADLFADAAVEGIGFVVDAPLVGQLHDDSYFDTDDKTVFAAARERMARQTGLEWAIVVGWADANQTTISKTIRVRPRIGNASTTPSALYESLGQSGTTYRLIEDYSSGKGANHIVATSSGQGDARPQSAPARDEVQISEGTPRWEYRFSPSTSINVQATLDGHAAAALPFMHAGAQALAITGRADAEPLLGRDWFLGDDLGYELTGPAHPDGLRGVARAYGWEFSQTDETITPLLLSPGEVLTA